MWVSDGLCGEEGRGEGPGAEGEGGAGGCLGAGGGGGVCGGCEEVGSVNGLLFCFFLWWSITLLFTKDNIGALQGGEGFVEPSIMSRNRAIPRFPVRGTTICRPLPVRSIPPFPLYTKTTLQDQWTIKYSKQPQGTHEIVAQAKPEQCSQGAQFVLSGTLKEEPTFGPQMA